MKETNSTDGNMNIQRGQVDAQVNICIFYRAFLSSFRLEKLRENSLILYCMTLGHNLI